MTYIVIERETDAPNYEYKEEFNTLEEAQSRMHQMYKDVVINGNPDVIDKAELFSRSAYVYIGDNEISWDIEENEI